MSKQLLSTETLVESPFIILTIKNYTFGTYTKSGELNKFGQQMKVTYPNYMESLNLVTVNGAVNQYVIRMVYGITAGADPNFLDKVFSTIGYNEIKISYGDWNSPSFIYKEKTAIITKVQSQIDFSGSRIVYSISCVSNSFSLSANKFDFVKRNEKPSVVIEELLYDRESGLLDVFYGMKNKQVVRDNHLILTDDKAVIIEAKKQISPLDYLTYLVSCMTPLSDTSNSTIREANYYISIQDIVSDSFKGPYFKLTKIGVNTITTGVDTYEVDVGYPTNNFVTRFTIDNNQAYSIFYNCAQNLEQPQYVYRVGDDGKIITEYSPSISNSSQLLRTTETDKNWWTEVTQFPITATLVLKGLIRPSILMSFVKLNVLFYGARHISSGTYVITRQEDTLDSTGYRTTLKLTRVKGDMDEQLSGFNKLSSVSHGEARTV